MNTSYSDREMLAQARALIAWFNSQDIDRTEGVCVMMNVIAAIFLDGVKSERDYRKSVDQLTAYAARIADEQFNSMGEE